MTQLLICHYIFNKVLHDYSPDPYALNLEIPFLGNFCKQDKMFTFFS